MKIEISQTQAVEFARIILDDVIQYTENQRKIEFEVTESKGGDKE